MEYLKQEVSRAKHLQQTGLVTEFAIKNEIHSPKFGHDIVLVLHRESNALLKKSKLPTYIRKKGKLPSVLSRPLFQLSIPFSISGTSATTDTEWLFKCSMYITKELHIC